MTTAQLLAAWRDSAPRRAAEAGELLRAAGIDDDELGPLLIFIAAAPGPVGPMPTLDARVSRPLTPMLAARFAFAGAVDDFGGQWPSLTQLPVLGLRRELHDTVQSIRTEWDGAVIADVPDDRLSVLVVASVEDGDYVFLVWPTTAGEPAVVSYASRHETRFDDLDAYLRWCTAPA